MQNYYLLSRARLHKTRGTSCEALHCARNPEIYRWKVSRVTEWAGPEVKRARGNLTELRSDEIQKESETD